MASKIGVQPRLIGPDDPVDEDGLAIPTFRTIGFRKSGRDRPPIAHAKLALLGNVCWTDEHPSGDVDDYVWLSPPRRLRVSSANFTYGSRRSLEFGYWTEDEDLVNGVMRFLVGLIGASDRSDPGEHRNRLVGSTAHEGLAKAGSSSFWRRSGLLSRRPDKPLGRADAAEERGLGGIAGLVASDRAEACDDLRALGATGGCLAAPLLEGHRLGLHGCF
ncbi:phospholipase D-like domain-containing protein [Conexibacter woesei]|uniref:hypothetical protein n=1 Tax=Conexibacter woesei TaxID=191495 RepID=UPI0011D1FE4C|nr:hypothetical protein [Conexibacter woesei]